MWRGTQMNEENLALSIINILEQKQKNDDCTAMITKLRIAFPITPKGYKLIYFNLTI